MGEVGSRKFCFSKIIRDQISHRAQKDSARRMHAGKLWSLFPYGVCVLQFSVSKHYESIGITLLRLIPSSRTSNEIEVGFSVT